MKQCDPNRVEHLSAFNDCLCTFLIVSINGDGNGTAYINIDGLILRLVNVRRHRSVDHPFYFLIHHPGLY